MTATATVVAVPQVSAGSAAAATPTPAQDAALRAEAAPGIVILATSDAWIEVRDPAGAVVFSRLLHAGQSWPVPPAQTLALTTGNAGGTELVTNGVASAPLGAPGTVLRNVALPVGPAPAPASAAPPASAPPASAPPASAPPASAPLASAPPASAPLASVPLASAPLGATATPAAARP